MKRAKETTKFEVDLVAVEWYLEEWDLVRRGFETAAAILKMVQDVDSLSTACMGAHGCGKLHRAIDRPLAKPSKRIDAVYKIPQT
ncbi:hypothetical protein QUB63_09625 [Microcoleus sp. ARI1-B5]|uniref:hypothetical protein n=1 Tax=unclassified Microcoleus TaxID=2642155 RepID=UPI002FD06AC4